MRKSDPALARARNERDPQDTERASVWEPGTCGPLTRPRPSFHATGLRGPLRLEGSVVLLLTSYGEAQALGRAVVVLVVLAVVAVVAVVAVRARRRHPEAPTIRCPRCGTEVWAGARCPHCGFRSWR